TTTTTEPSTTTTTVVTTTTTTTVDTTTTTTSTVTTTTTSTSTSSTTTTAPSTTTTTGGGTTTTTTPGTTTTTETSSTTTTTGVTTTTTVGTTTTTTTTTLGNAVSVDADSEAATRTGFIVGTDDRLIVTAFGEITIESGGTDVGPSGRGESCGAGCPMPNQNWGALIGDIFNNGEGSGGTCLFKIGNRFDDNPPCNGELALLVNDRFYLDNAGSFSVEYEISDEPIPTDDDEEEVDEEDNSIADDEDKSGCGGAGCSC
ncbi:MAG: hypothetical protein H6683_06220, partial [Deltaproteobacteria bacterium]|nr:hypothetical protein [Deltaproteobacteria bacterium]